MSTGATPTTAPVTPTDVESKLERAFIARSEAGRIWHVAEQGNGIQGVKTGCNGFLNPDNVNKFARYAENPIRMTKMCPHCIVDQFNALSNGEILHG